MMNSSSTNNQKFETETRIEMDNIDAMFESEFWRACDLDEIKTFSGKIAQVDQKKLTIPGTSQTKVKPVISFSNSKKKLALNKTNVATIKKVLGKKTSAWIGCSVTLFQINDAKLGDKIVDAIRVKNVRKPDGKKAKPQTTNNAPTTAELDSAMMKIASCDKQQQLDEKLDEIRKVQWTKEQRAKIAQVIKTVSEKVSKK